MALEDAPIDLEGDGDIKPPQAAYDPHTPVLDIFEMRVLVHEPKVLVDEPFLRDCGAHGSSGLVRVFR